MMTLSIPTAGEVDAVALPRLLGQLGRSAGTGTLVVDHDGGLSRAFFRDGRPAGATVFAHFKPLGVLLMERGIIDIEALDRSLAEVARTRRPQGQILVELGVLTPEALAEGLQLQQTGNLMRLLSIESGRFTFEASEPLPAWTEEIALDPFRILRELFEQEEQMSRVDTLLRQMGEGAVRYAPRSETSAAFDLDAPSLSLLEGLAEPRRVTDVIAEAGGEARWAGALLATAWCFGWLEPAAEAEGAAPARPASEAKDAAPARPAPEAEDAAPEAGTEPPAPAEDATAAPARPRTTKPGDKDRRGRMLRQAFRNIRGAERVGPPSAPAADPARPEKTQATAPARAAPPAPKAGSRGQSNEAVSPEARDVMRELSTVKKRIEDDDYYKRLGIERRASLAEVKAAYLTLVKRYHPDRVAALALPPEAAEDLHGVFEAIQEAYDTLRDPKRRDTYDGLLNDARIQGDRGKARKVAGAEVEFKKGEGLFKKKDWAGALKHLEKAREVDRTHGRCEVLHAWARYNVGPKEKLKGEVRNQLARASNLPGGSALAHYYLGLLARIDDELSKAERHFRQAAEGDPRLVEAVTELRAVRRRMEKENTTSTQRLFKKVLGKD